MISSGNIADAIGGLIEYWLNHGFLDASASQVPTQATPPSPLEHQKSTL